MILGYMSSMLTMSIPLLHGMPICINIAGIIHTDTYNRMYKDLTIDTDGPYT